MMLIHWKIYWVTLIQKEGQSGIRVESETFSGEQKTPAGFEEQNIVDHLSESPAKEKIIQECTLCYHRMLLH